MKRTYPDRLFGSISRFINVLILNGHPSESISGRSWRSRLEQPHNNVWKQATRVIDFIFFWDREHTRTSYLLDIQYATERLKRHQHLSQIKDQGIGTKL